MSDPEAEGTTLRLIACDSCRSRKLMVIKVRCDKQIPCSSCKSSRIACRTTQKTLEKRHRVLISSRYEQEIADVNKQLKTLSHTLQALAGSSTHNSTAQGQHRPSPNDGLPTPSHDSQTGFEGSFEGESSFSTQSRQATEAFEATVREPPHEAGDEAVLAAVSTLQNLLEERGFTQIPSLSSIPQAQETVLHPELATLPSLPTHVVLKVLKVARTQPQRFFTEFPLVDVASFTESCQRVYFPTEEYSIATFIIVNGGMFLLFRALSNDAKLQLGLNPIDHARNTAICSSNVDVAVRNLRLSMTPSLENIKAFLLAAALALDSSIRSSAWTLVSAAARMSLDAGLHRLPKSGQENRDQRMTFWMVYNMDHALALNLGRAPNIQDYDITTGRLIYPDDVDGIWGRLYSIWIDHAKLQGLIYVQLYSAQAQNNSVDIKTERARLLAISAVNLQEQLHASHDMESPIEEATREILLSVEITFHSTLTLIYRMIPPTHSTHPLQFGDQCVLSARKALTLHNDAWPEITQRGDDHWRVFVHWSTLFNPFVPFIVVFGNAIARSDYNDVALLGTFVMTLQSVAELSGGVRKLHHACSHFYQIAKAHLAHVAPSHDTQIPHDWHQSGQQSLPDLSLSRQDWDGMLDDWELGIGAENARQMSSFFEPYMIESQNKSISE